MKNIKKLIIIIGIIVGILLVLGTIFIFNNSSENKVYNSSVNNVENVEVVKIEKEIEFLENKIDELLTSKNNSPVVNGNNIIEEDNTSEQIISIQKKVNELQMKKQDLIQQEKLEKELEDIKTDDSSVFDEAAKKLKENINK